MGRRLRRTRRGLLGRSLLLLALVLVVSALGFAWLGWRSLRREHSLRLREMDHQAERVLDRRVTRIVDELARLQDAEAARPYYDYQDQLLAENVQYATLGFQSTPLARAPQRPLLSGWFQWELYAGRTYDEPAVFPPQAVALRHQIARAYGEDLAFRLERAPQGGLLQGSAGREERYPLRVVAANEERGKLQEEMLQQQRQQAGQQLRSVSGNLGDAEVVSGSPYLDSFARRTYGDDAIRVRYSPFRYLARPGTVDGPELLAWRLVWIPATHAARREVRRDRWIIQGYAVDLREVLPVGWQREGVTQIGGAGAVEATLGAGPVHRASLIAALGAEVATLVETPSLVTLQAASEEPEPATNAALEMVARVHPSAGAEAWRQSRNRFLWLVAGVSLVVILGFALLLRTIHGELALVRRKEDFMAAITHELKTPLTGIRMYADMLKEGWVSSPEAAERYADRILEESDRLGHLVNQVLDLAALERGIAEVHAKPGDLGAAVHEAVQLMEAKAAQHEVAMHVDIASGLPVVSFDPRLVRPLVLNLVDNAIKYSVKSDTKQVRVSVSQDGERVEVRVQDQGVGISPALRRRLFEPFQRAGDELTRDAPGMGIGLALVKRYADAHRARVSVDSELGEGTTVRVRFPIAREG